MKSPCRPRSPRLLSEASHDPLFISIYWRRATVFQFSPIHIALSAAAGSTSSPVPGTKAPHHNITTGKPQSFRPLPCTFYHSALPWPAGFLVDSTVLEEWSCTSSGGNESTPLEWLVGVAASPVCLSFTTGILPGFTLSIKSPENNIIWEIELYEVRRRRRREAEDVESETAGRDEGAS